MFFVFNCLTPHFSESFLQNGMTSLHLSVWHSLRAEDCSTVKALLKHDANCSAEDNVL